MELTREEWDRVRDGFEEALDVPVEQRSAYLNRAFAGADSLRAEVEALLDAEARSGPLLEEPVGEFAAALIQDFARQRTHDESVSWIGNQVGPYRLTREIGRGGMGAVYLAERADGQFRQTVAIKLLPPGIDRFESRRRLLAERQILARLEHPAIARLFDGGITEDGTPYLVMEYVRGARSTSGAKRAKHPSIPAWMSSSRYVMPLTTRTATSSCIAISSRQTS